MRIDAIEAIGDHFADRAMQFGGQFSAGRAGTDDRDVELAGSTGPSCVCARRQALTRRRLKRSACASVSSGTAYSATPGVPKSLVMLPTAITSVS